MQVSSTRFDGITAFIVVDASGANVTREVTKAPFAGYTDRFDLLDALAAQGYVVPISGQVRRPAKAGAR